MKRSRRRRTAGPMLAALLLMAATGCNMIGPVSLESGRRAYNAAVIATHNEQTLDLIVRLRYGEMPGMLSVAAITANVSIRSSAFVQAGVGADSNYAGNLVPFSGGVVFEENPTITYVPLEGEKYVRQLLAPIPIDLVLLVCKSRFELSESVTQLFATINGIDNPGFLSESEDVDPRFGRAAELLQRLNLLRSVGFGIEPEKKRPALLISRDTLANRAAMKELSELLGLTEDATGGGPLVLPVVLADGVRDGRILSVETRSVFDMVVAAAAATTVPEEHLESGLARTFPRLGALGDSIDIRCSDSPPEHAFVALRHHDQWFYIDARDQGSKGYFTLLQTLISVQLSDTVDTHKFAPVLTTPTGQ